MSYFPFYLDITNKTFLIIGGGPVALEKVSRLRRFTEDIIAATGIREVDRKVAEDCRSRGIPVNVVDDQEYCDFIFPSIVRRDSLTIAISTSGTSPAYAMQLRKEIEQMLPDEIGPILTRMGSLRSEVSKQIQDQKARAATYRQLLAELIASGNRLNDEEISRIIRQNTEEPQITGQNTEEPT